VESQPNQHVTDPAAIERGHEGTEVSIRGIVLALIGMLVAGGVALIVSWWLMNGVETYEVRRDVPRSPLASQQQPPPAPWLQPSAPQGPEPRQPWQDMEAYRRDEEQKLASYAVNARTGLVQIPIERAMLILAAPTTGPTTRPTATRPNREPSGGLPR
jgi:hypothetical protein